MKNNKVYFAIIILLLVIIAFLVILLFMGDSGKYCVPITKQKIHIPETFFDKDSLVRMDSLSSEY